MTLTRTADRYVVHELLSANDEVTPCTPPDVMHSSECQGKDIRAGEEDGFWRAFVTKGDVAVDAGPILHRGRSCITTITARAFTQSACQDPCIGYIIRESPPFSRKIVILGDTYDPTALLPLCCFPCPSLLIHESTDAHIPLAIDNLNSKRNKENVETKTRDRGHSTPGMAGSFAKLVGAKQLVLNHIGSRFPAPQSSNWKRMRDSRVAAMKEVERQASEAWGEGKAQAAVDFMRVEVDAVSDTYDPGRMEE
jgi:ribonuclease Z